MLLNNFFERTHLVLALRDVDCFAWVTLISVVDTVDWRPILAVAIVFHVRGALTANSRIASAALLS